MNTSKKLSWFIHRLLKIIPLIDGYPRKHENYDEWVVQNDQSDNKVDIKWLLYIEVPDDIMLERVIERAKIENREFDDLGMYIYSFRILL